MEQYEVHVGGTAFRPNLTDYKYDADLNGEWYTILPTPKEGQIYIIPEHRGLIFRAKESEPTLTPEGDLLPPTIVATEGSTLGFHTHKQWKKAMLYMTPYYDIGLGVMICATNIGPWDVKLRVGDLLGTLTVS